ncbi:fimbria/pilus periplasmic chaperone [Stenotrophomonas sp. AN71]|uniref:fimbria/pilus periplasmic chaperone n=1 Tax=Stenotrophomonas sp. AN71 TaxID=3156253 RepID=UPI003D1B716B
MCATLLAAGSASANMSVYPMSVDIGAQGEAASTIQVYSKSEETQFVKVSVKRVLQPGTAQEHEEEVNNWEGIGLVVSPPKFALPAGGSRAVRIVGMAAPKSEEVYRVYFEQVPLPSGEAEAEGTQSAAKTKLSVNLIWGVLVRMVPADPQVALERSGPSRLHNAGNIRLGLLKVGRCTGSDDASCQWQTLEKNIYPGMDLEVPGTPSGSLLRVKYQVDSTPDIQSKDLAAVR